MPTKFVLCLCESISHSTSCLRPDGSIDPSAKRKGHELALTAEDENKNSTMIYYETPVGTWLRHVPLIASDALTLTHNPM